MITKRAGSRAGRVAVTFQLPESIWAESVHLVGDFNDWNRRSHPLTRSRDDATWQITLELDQGKSYQFRYLVNGADWQNDWNADRYVPNPYGGENSVLDT
jgi:1,4-alpha-glucan branching enzyme